MATPCSRRCTPPQRASLTWRFWRACGRSRCCEWCSWENYLTVTDEQGREVITRREAEVEGLPPGRSRIASPYDTDTRWGLKRDTFCKRLQDPRDRDLRHCRPRP